MPCNTTQTAEVELGKVNKELFAAAIASDAIRTLGISGYIEADGKVRLRYQNTIDAQEATRLVKQAYSRQVVFSQAKRYGWVVKETKANQFEVTRR